jgi:hypothetical protein
MLLEKFKRDHAPKRANPNGQRPIIATQMPPVPVVRSLYGEIARTLGGNVRPTARFFELEHAKWARPVGRTIEKGAPTNGRGAPNRLLIAAAPR